MLQRGFVVLLRAVGKRYEPDPELPGGLLASTLRVRLVALLRGLIRFRAAVFIGPGVRVRGKRSIQLGRFSTVDRGCQIDGYAACGVRVGDRTKLGAGTIVSCTSHLSKLGVGVRIGSDCGIGENGYFGASGGVTRLTVSVMRGASSPPCSASSKNPRTPQDRCWWA